MAKIFFFQTLANFCVFPDFLLKSICICVMISNFDRKMMIFRRYLLKSVCNLYDDLDVSPRVFAPGLLYLNDGFKKTFNNSVFFCAKSKFFKNHRVNIEGLEQKIRAKHPNRRTNHVRVLLLLSNRTVMYEYGAVGVSRMGRPQDKPFRKDQTVRYLRISMIRLFSYGTPSRLTLQEWRTKLDRFY